MSSSYLSLPDHDISDVMILLSAMKRENEKAMKDILTKLTRIEDDNRKLRQELQDIKSSQRQTIKVLSKKRNEPGDEAEHKNEHLNNKKARVSAASLPEPEPEPKLELELELESPASFNTLDDDCLCNVLDFVGKKSYSLFGRVNKRCHGMFCSKGLPKETYLYGYGPLHLIQQHRSFLYGYGPLHLIQQRRNLNSIRFSKGVLHYNRRDILDWILADESEDYYWKLKRLCHNVIKESRLDILCEIFQRANVEQLEFLRDGDNDFDLCWTAAEYGKLECLKLLRENEVEWNEFVWREAKENEHEHILKYLRNNGYPRKWQIDSEDY